MSRHTLPSSTCGIYHLIKNDRVVYVGQSTNAFLRVGSWAAAMPGAFDEWEFFACDKSELDRLEYTHILKFDPPMNKSGRERCYHGVNRRPLTMAVRRHGSLRAYFNHLRPFVTGGEIRAAGLHCNNRELLAMPGFPEPAEVRQHGTTWVCRWRREEVLRWMEAREKQEDKEKARCGTGLRVNAMNDERGSDYDTPTS